MSLCMCIYVYTQVWRPEVNLSSSGAFYIHSFIHSLLKLCLIGPEFSN